VGSPEGLTAISLSAALIANCNCKGENYEFPQTDEQ
jgi:hypothetical protein